MRWAMLGIGLSLAIHAGAVVAVASIPKNMRHTTTAITVADSKKAKKDEAKKDEPKKEEPPKPIHAPEAPVKRAAPPKAAPADNTPPPPAAPAAAPAAQAPSLAALPDLGLSFGNAGGPGGMAIAAPPPGAAGDAASRPKPGDAPKGVAPKPKAEEECSDADVKPKPLTHEQGAYTAGAQSAGIEGKVRLRLTIDESGTVTSVSVIQGLGYGLDESAIAAAKRMKFSPAMHCGRAASGSTVFAMVFHLPE